MCMIRPHLDCIDFVIELGSAEEGNLKIEYCIVPKNRSDLKLLQEKYGIEDLKIRRKRNMAKIMFSQSSIAENKCTNRTNMNLRSAKKVKLKNNFTTKTKVYNSPFYWGQRLWDTLPADLQKEDDVHSFKKRLKLYKFS